MAIFQESIVQKHLSNLDGTEIDSAFKRYKEVYGVQKIENIKKAKEEQYQEGFIKDIFGQVLGYSIFPEQPFNIQTETKNATNSKKADGAIFQGDNVVGVIELKDNKTRNLDAVKDQAFGYKNNHKDCSYVISSNFHKLRFYIDDATEYEEFDLYNLDKETFKRFYLYLRKEGLLDKDIPKLLRQETKFHEENITKSLYKDYSGFKNRFFENAVNNNPQFDKVLLFKKSQKFLDKVLFVLFAEDKGLINTNSIVSIVEKWQSLKDDAFDNPKPLYYLVNFFFGNLYQGKKDQQGKTLVPEFGGEIFAPDEILDNLLIDDNILKDDLLKLSKYDFNTDVDVNILGHIFEHSLSEIEEVEASLSGVIADKTKGKRKKDGVFYTPKYITKYIVDNTLGKLCLEKKQLLELDLDVAIFEHQKADGKLNSKGIILFEKINEYKKWLMSLKIVDPACGSGAFLNQAVNFLIEEHKYFDDLIAELTNSPLRLFDIDIAILENNIYGVDINEESIEIAKLSLWLRTARPGRKLSNLSNNIKCGNSLIDDPAVAGDKAFNWQNEFPEVFANGGFDVVIGNPPYGAIISQKNLYADKYGFKTNCDTYQMFSILAEYLLNQKGLCGFIIPNSWMNRKGGEEFRKKLSLYKLYIVIDFVNQVFEDANIDTCIIIYSKDFNSLNNEVLALNVEIPESILSNITYNKIKFEYWVKYDKFNCSFNYSTFEIFEKLKCNSINLGDLALITGGYKPYQVGYGKSIDGDFPQTKKDVENWVYHSTNKIDETYFPDIKGGNIQHYFIKPNIQWVKWGNWLMSPKKLEDFINPKIVVREVAGKKLNCCFDDYGYFTNDTTHMIRGIDSDSLKFILTLINSNLLGWFFRKFFGEANDLFPKIKVNELKDLPIKQIPNFEQIQFTEKADLMLTLNKDLEEQSRKFQRTIQRKFELDELPKKLQDWYKLSYSELIKELAKKKVILSLSQEVEWEDYFTSESQKALELKSQIDRTDKEIDLMVYELYDLTEEEIQIIENS